MEENPIFQPPENQVPGEKPSYTPAMVLGILSILNHIIGAFLISQLMLMM